MYSNCEYEILGTNTSLFWALIGVIYGPHGAPDFFSEDYITKIFASSWKVHHNNRLGVRLIGPPDIFTATSVITNDHQTIADTAQMVQTYLAQIHGIAATSILTNGAPDDCRYRTDGADISHTDSWHCSNFNPYQWCTRRLLIQHRWYKDI